MTSTKPGRLTGDIDLLSYYNLIPIYNKVVKPYPPSNRSEGIEPTLLPYINYLPGKLDMEPDGYLINILRDPQVNETGPDIKPLDMDTLKDAFTLKEGPVPGFDVSILGTDDGNTLAQYNGVEKDNNGNSCHVYIYMCVCTSIDIIPLV
ncbi:hypothetical protein BDB01DRAFT_769205 [Pilobolus umbonatus]|nr:hypothetical protein BDB01DRAFT_769205 [Pilobolus umbonatus]